MGIGMLDDPIMRSTFEDAMRSSGATGTFDFEDFKSVFAGTLVVLAILGAGMYLLVAFFIRKGKNWARILGTVFAALSVFSLFQVPNSGPGNRGWHRGDRSAVPAVHGPVLPKQQPFANPYSSPGNPYGH